MGFYFPGKYTSLAKCVVTPLSSNCNNPMWETLVIIIVFTKSAFFSGILCQNFSAMETSRETVISSRECSASWTIGNKWPLLRLSLLMVTTLRYGGECGRVGFDWCANGDDFVAGTLQAGPGRTQVIKCWKFKWLKIGSYKSTVRFFMWSHFILF